MIKHLFIGDTQNFENDFVGTTKNEFGIAIAFYSGLWTYKGWNSLNSMTEELENPKRNLWLSIVLTLPGVIVLYVLTNISYFTVMNKETLLASKVVAVTWGEAVLGPAVRVLPILILICALGSVNGSLFGVAQYCMVGVQYGYLPEVFACIHKTRLAPMSGIVFEVPIPLIMIIVLISMYLVIAPLISSPSISFIFASIWILFGLVFYYSFAYRKIELNIVRKENVQY
ncbi:unnamed protein product [Rotaria socialis]|uniref:Uncharacterized protein n=2 Tax=Rotaria socialis TaxID=392032 RepID=A0A821IXV1_9BILA|nr:unnamed protein product [Rotaria socialis]CAF4708329.1 unnamed protein product [Rotaria socialis]